MFDIIYHQEKLVKNLLSFENGARCHGKMKRKPSLTFQEIATNVGSRNTNTEIKNTVK